MRFLVTGSAGFIGYHVSRLLLDRGHEVFGLDTLTNYYDVRLKQTRLSLLKTYVAYRHNKEPESIDCIIHLAGQPGVRRSSETASLHFERNTALTFRMFDLARASGTKRLIYASSSSVYGLNSFYACTKAACEAIATGFKRDVDSLGLRLFPTYGELGRPDMAPWRFAAQMLTGEPITINGSGNQMRDYTYVGDTAAQIVRYAIEGFEPGIVDVGRGRLRSVIALAHTIEQTIGTTGAVKYAPSVEGETDDLVSSVPCGSVDLEQGVPLMVASAREWVRRCVEYGAREAPGEGVRPPPPI